MTDFIGDKPKDRPSVSNLEGTHVTVPYVDKNDAKMKVALVEVRKPPSPIEIPKEQELTESIVGFCSGCRVQCQMTFPAGFNQKSGDRALQGKSVEAFCPRCQKMTEFLPAATYQDHPLVMRNQRNLRASKGLSERDFR